MVSQHFIRKNNKEEELILFLDYDYEFSVFKRGEHDSIKNDIKKYIEDHKLKFDGKKILLVIGGIVIASFVYTNEDIYFESFNNENIDYIDNTVISDLVDVSATDTIKVEKEQAKETTTQVEEKKSTTQNSTSSKTTTSTSEKKTTTNSTTEKSTTSKSATNNNTTTNKSTTSKSTTSTTTKETTTSTISKKTVTVYRQSGQVITLDIEEYVIGVVAAEMPASFNAEALKAQAILARTYALKSEKTGKKLTDTVSTQAYIDVSQMKSKWGSDFSKYYNKIKQAVQNTEGKYITYQGQIIDAVYHSTSNGYTEDAIEVWGHSVPYLKSVESSWDKNASSYLKSVYKEIDDVLKIFGITNLEEIEIIKKDASGRISQIKIGEEIYSGTDVRELLQLRSTDFEFEVVDGKLKITTRGYGHGVGLSQYGANGMAKAGYSYDKILKHYYTGISIVKL